MKFIVETHSIEKLPLRKDPPDKTMKEQIGLKISLRNENEELRS